MKNMAVVVVFAAMALAGLAACGGSDTKPASSPENSASAASTASSAAPADTAAASPPAK